MKKIFSIGEAATEIDVNTHVIRNWCEKFTNLKIQKGIGGRRYFDENTISEMKKIKTLIEKYGMSIEGIKHLIKHDKIKPDFILQDLSCNQKQVNITSEESLQTAMQSNEMFNKINQLQGQLSALQEEKNINEIKFKNYIKNLISIIED
jgi:DNA-binding transcriptional MerR regulator